MSYSIKLFGLALILVSAWLAGVGYSSYRKRRLSEIKGFVQLITYIEKRVTLFLSTQRQMLVGYEDESISSFIGEVTAGKTFFDAFSSVKGKMWLSEEMKEKLSDFFFEFGKSYRDSELKRIEMFKKEIIEIQNREEEETPGKIKLLYTLLFALALSVVIILL